MQFSPVVKNSKTITIAECINAIKAIKQDKPSSEYIKLKESQKRFLWCVVNKY